ncbi:ABC transporter permease [Actinacidiphila yanglinensis]|uniref:ABC transporter permease n=1 Tax=Actinacidiphila yanglinensis TaxID=310779 RepID=UPI00190E9A84|nr:ABC transporter permease [Actinacidiphila yanglinensis]
MSPTTPAGPVPPAVPRGSVLGRLALAELTLFVREKAGPVLAVWMPMMLLVVFGNIPFYNRPRQNLGGSTLLDLYVPILAAFVLATVSFNVVPQVLAGYREKGVLRRLRTTPVGPARVLAAQLLVNLATAAVSVIALLVVARLAFGVWMPRRLGGYVLALVLAALALTAIGLFVAAASPNGRIASAVGATLFYVMMFFAGLFLPIAAMPALLRHVCRATPLGAAVQALTDATEGHGPHPLQLVTLACYAVVFGVAAVRLFRWE